LQKGEIGMLLTALIITMPTVAAALWQGNMGTFMHFSAFAAAVRLCRGRGAAGRFLHAAPRSEQRCLNTEPSNDSEHFKHATNHACSRG
jgi:hypothetical protein